MQVSTDEVYGSLGPTGAFTETTPLSPSSPYSASKAAADLLVQAYHHTFGLPAVITRCSNNYGPYQFPEKLIPLFITNALRDEPVPVYGDGMQRPRLDPRRGPLHRHLGGVAPGRPGEVYNVGGGNEVPNLEITNRCDPRLRAARVADPLRPGPPRARPPLRHRHRPPASLGWARERPFVDGLAATVDWYRDNRDWWEPIKSGEYGSTMRRSTGAADGTRATDV